MRIVVGLCRQPSEANSRQHQRHGAFGYCCADTPLYLEALELSRTRMGLAPRPGADNTLGR
jgi:hypothetical protein